LSDPLNDPLHSSRIAQIPLDDLPLAAGDLPPQILISNKLHHAFLQVRLVRKAHPL
jgi:hypothetical protein